MYQIRVTTLEKFRRWKDNVSDWDTEESFIESLTGKFTGNYYTIIGTAFHSIVENGESIVTDVNGVKMVQTDNGPAYFNVEQVKVALDYKSETPLAIHELRLYKSYNTKYGKVTITGCADQIDGFVLHDIKTKYSTVKQQEYIDSCQWRYYMELFELDDFVFDLFLFPGYNTDMGTNVSGLSIERYEPIPCLRYATMEEDNAELLAGFLDYVFSKNLQQYIMEESLFNAPAESPAVQSSAPITADKLTVDASSINELTVKYEPIQAVRLDSHIATLKAVTGDIHSQAIPGISATLNDAKKAGKDIDKAVDTICRPLKDLKKKIDGMQNDVKAYAAEYKQPLTAEVNRVENLLISYTQREQERVARQQKIAATFQAEGMTFDGKTLSGFGLNLDYADLLTRSAEELNGIMYSVRLLKSSMPQPEVKQEAPAPVVQAPVEMPQAVKGMTTVRKYEVVNPAIIPLEYYTLDTAKITAAVKGGIAEIPGVRIFEEKQIRTTR